MYGMRLSVKVVGSVSLLVATGCDTPNDVAAPPATSATPSAAPRTTGAPSAVAPPPPATTPPPAAAPDTVIAQHVLVIYSGAKRAPKTITRTKSEARSRAREALAKIVGGAAFEDIVKDYSDDAGSVGRMGSVG